MVAYAAVAPQIYGPCRSKKDGCGSKPYGQLEHLTPVAPLLAVLPHFRANGSTNSPHAFGLIASPKAQSNAPSISFRSADS
jgi:hypothetical protein